MVIVGWVAREVHDLLLSRRQTGKIESRAAEKSGAVRVHVRNDLRGFELGEYEAIEIVADPRLVLLLHLGKRRTVERMEGPGKVSFRAVAQRRQAEHTG